MSDTRYDILNTVYGAVMDALTHSEALAPEGKSLIKTFRRFDDDREAGRVFTHGIMKPDMPPAAADTPCLDVYPSASRVDVAWTNQTAQDYYTLDFRLWCDTIGISTPQNLYMRVLAALETSLPGRTKTYIEDAVGTRPALTPLNRRMRVVKLGSDSQSQQGTLIEWSIVVPVRYNQFRSIRSN